MSCVHLIRSIHFLSLSLSVIVERLIFSIATSVRATVRNRVQLHLLDATVRIRTDLVLSNALQEFSSITKMLQNITATMFMSVLKIREETLWKMRKMKSWNVPVECRGDTTTLFLLHVLQFLKHYKFRVFENLAFFLPALAFFLQRCLATLL